MRHEVRSANEPRKAVLSNEPTQLRHAARYGCREELL